MKIEKLKKFRQTAYQLLGNGKDATMDLMDAVLVTRSVYSFAELSLSPVFRRKWSSLYETMEDCRPLRRGLMKLYGEQIPLDKRVILAGAHTSWPRLDAKTLKDRTLYVGRWRERSYPNLKKNKKKSDSGRTLKQKACFVDKEPPICSSECHLPQTGQYQRGFSQKT
jgi:hypothetical protein